MWASRFVNIVRWDENERMWKRTLQPLELCQHKAKIFPLFAFCVATRIPTSAYSYIHRTFDDQEAFLSCPCRIVPSFPYVVDQIAQRRLESRNKVEWYSRFRWALSCMWVMASNCQGRIHGKSSSSLDFNPNAVLSCSNGLERREKVPKVMPVAISYFGVRKMRFWEILRSAHGEEQ